jgi:hypothetical protein
MQTLSPALKAGLALIDAKVGHGVLCSHKRLARGYLRHDPRVIFLSPYAMRIRARYVRRFGWDAKPEARP